MPGRNKKNIDNLNSDNRQRNMRNAGPGGYCVCPACGERIIHRQGVPCSSEKCPKCNNIMVRE